MFSAVPLTGNVQFFVSACPHGTPAAECALPAACDGATEKHDCLHGDSTKRAQCVWEGGACHSPSASWYSEDASQQMALTIRKEDPNWCADCVYLVGVTARGSEVETRFSLTASLSTGTVKLQVLSFGPDI